MEDSFRSRRKVKAILVSYLLGNTCSCGIMMIRFFCQNDTVYPYYINILEIQIAETKVQIDWLGDYEVYESRLRAQTFQ